MLQRRDSMGWAVAALLAWASAGAQAEWRFRIQELGYEGGHGPSEFFEPAAINNRGQVVGYLQQEVQQDDYTELLSQAYVSSGNRLVPLPGSSAFRESSASGINDRGQIIGHYQRSGILAQFPFLYDHGQYRDLRVEGKVDWDNANDINASGQIVGRANARAYLFDGRQARYIDIPGAVASEAGSLNDRGTVLGTAYFDVNGTGSGFEQRAWIYDGQQVKFLPDPIHEGYSGLGLADINNAGQIVGRTFRPDDESYRSFFYDADGRFTDLGGLYGRTERTYVTELNDRGWAVGLATAHCNEFSCHEAFLWRDGQMSPLTGLLVPSQAQGWLLTSAASLNDRGQIVGNGWHYGFFTTYVLTPVPEPQGWVLGLAGLGVVGMAARRRPLPRRKATPCD